MLEQILPTNIITPLKQCFIRQQVLFAASILVEDDIYIVRRVLEEGILGIDDIYVHASCQGCGLEIPGVYSTQTKLPRFVLLVQSELLYIL
jgi:hypothetical protein